MPRQAGREWGPAGPGEGLLRAAALAATSRALRRVRGDGRRRRTRRGQAGAGGGAGSEQGGGTAVRRPPARGPVLPRPERQGARLPRPQGGQGEPRLQPGRQVTSLH